MCIRAALVAVVIVTTMEVACVSAPGLGGTASDDADADARSADDDVIDCSAVAGVIDIAAQVAANAGATRGRYPVVLSHGFFGFDSVGPLEYFVGVAEALRAAGFAVYVTAVEPVAATDATRGPALGGEIECIARASGAARLNLVGHSQGGLDVRFVASDPEHQQRVASVTTIATPHRGTPLADAALGLMPGIADELADTLAELWGALVDAPDDQADLRAGMEQMTTANMEAWNQQHPDTPGIGYFSWGGRSVAGLADLDLGEAACAGAVHANPSARDLIDPLLSATFAFLRQAAGPNDGLVDVASTRWGTFMGCLAADHMDQVGLGSISSTDPFSGFNHRDFFVNLATELEDRGY